MKRSRVASALSLLALAVGAGQAAAQQADTVATTAPLYSRTDAWLAAGFAVGVVAFAPYDERIAAWSQSGSVQTSSRTSVANVFNWGGGSGVILLSTATYGVGRIAGSRPLSEIGLRATEAIVISGAITGLAKGVFGRRRPYVNVNDPDYFVVGRGFTNGAYASMPSGHATAAFAFASAITDETHRWWPKQTWWVATLSYGGATMVGVARIYSDKHWSSDVVAGAMVGTLTGLGVVRWHRAHPKSKLDRWLLPSGVAPARGGANLTWAVTF